MKKNIYALAFVGLAMQFGASFIHFTGNVFLVGSLLTTSQHLLIRNLSESVPHILKIFGGYLSDVFENRKVFLLIGYGSMIILKGCFFMTAFRDVFSITFLFYLYIFTQFTDRCMNAFRDSARDALLVDSDGGKTFGIRKGIASLGSIFAGIFCYFTISKGYLGMKTIYGLSIIPVIIANIILWKYVHNTSYTTKKIEKKIKIPIRPFIYIIIVIVSNIFIKYSLLSYILLYLILSLMIQFSFKSIMKNTIIFGLCLLFFKFSIENMKIVAPLSVFFTYCTALAMESSLAEEIYHHKNKLSELFLVVIINGLISLGRMNDTILLTHGESIGFSAQSTILLFALLYVSILCFSFLYNKIIQKSKIILAICTIISIMIPHINIIYSTNKLVFLSSIFSMGSFYAGSDVLLSTMLTKSIPSPLLRGTSFGLFHTISGMAIFANALIIHKITKLFDITYASRFCLISTCISVIFFIYYFIRYDR